MSPSFLLTEIPSDQISITSTSSENTLHKDKSSISSNSRLNINEDKKHLSLLANTNTSSTKEAITTTITTASAMTTSEFSVNRSFSLLNNGEISNRKLLDINHHGSVINVGEQKSPIRRKMSVGGLSTSIPSKNNTLSNPGNTKK